MSKIHVDGTVTDATLPNDDADVSEESRQEPAEQQESDEKGDASSPGSSSATTRASHSKSATKK